MKRIFTDLRPLELNDEGEHGVDSGKKAVWAEKLYAETSLRRLIIGLAGGSGPLGMGEWEGGDRVCERGRNGMMEDFPRQTQEGVWHVAL